MALVHPIPATVTVRYKIPVRTWWRLRVLARLMDKTMPSTCDFALIAGLNKIGITDDPDLLLADTGFPPKAASPSESD